MIFSPLGGSTTNKLETSHLTHLITVNEHPNIDASVILHVHIDPEHNFPLSHTDPAGAEETPEKNDIPLDLPKGPNLLKQILEEVKAARQEAEGQDKDKRKPGRYLRVAKIIDSVFFTFYFVAVVVFLTYMNVVWILKIE